MNIYNIVVNFRAFVNSRKTNAAVTEPVRNLRRKNGNFFQKSQKTIDFNGGIRYNSIKESVRATTIDIGNPCRRVIFPKFKRKLIRRIIIWHYR